MTTTQAAPAAIVAKATESQATAAQPETSAWVSAAAGTGKTTVLVNRLLRLLLDQNDPAKILCLTYTKAAAAEMQVRLTHRLGEWAVLPEEDLYKNLKALLGADFKPAPHLPLARQLFARVLDVPGGMKIMTIHGFCQSVLQRFPLEAEIPPYFELLTETNADFLLQDAIHEVVNLARQDSDAAHFQALVQLTRSFQQSTFEGLIKEMVFNRHKLVNLFATHGDVGGLVSALYKKLGVPPGQTAATLLTTVGEGASPALKGAAQQMADAGIATKNGPDPAVILKWLAASATQQHKTFQSYIHQFLIKSGKIKAETTFLSKKNQAALPGVLEIFKEEADRLFQIQNKLNAIEVAERSAALLRLGAGVFQTYQDHKARHGWLDYDDLIQKTHSLLSQPGFSAWVLYKLDGGINHILLDEAQDTNPYGWQILDKLVEDFLAGEGACDHTHTFFVVGDLKQSIFSFQGAAPEEFDRMRRYFQQRFAERKVPWAEVPLSVSFRSVSAVLTAVDAVMAHPDFDFGRDEKVPHVAKRVGAAGRVEVWPPQLPTPKDKTAEPWALPVPAQAIPSPEERVAISIAEQVDQWLKTGERLSARGRAIRAGDIMVLVQRRRPFVTALTRELQRRKIPVAGVDRLTLLEQIVIQDLMALGGFLCLPQDDLTLAALLKSPLYGLTEDNLFLLCHGRGGDSLWQRLQASPDHQQAVRSLKELLARVDFLTPFDLFSHVLNQGGRQKFYDRLGGNVQDLLDEFLSTCLEYEQLQTASLQGFVHWFGSHSTEIKREMADGAADEVRILTVHGAKGLQAPIVFLPDTFVDSEGQANKARIGWTKDAMVHLPRKEKAVPFTAAVQAAHLEKSRQESHRLLYVAMTRAEDRLYVCGWQTTKSPKEYCWYNVVHSALKGLAREEEGKLILEAPQTTEVLAEEVVSIPEHMAGALPLWADETIAAPAPAPSAPLLKWPSLDPLVADRVQWGTVVHKILHLFNGRTAVEAAVILRDYLAYSASEWSAEKSAQIAAEVEGLLNNKEISSLIFHEKAQAEVSVMAEEIGLKRMDLVVRTEEEILIVDYKTEEPPATVANVRSEYLRQLATYQAIFQKVTPQVPVRCAIIWTKTATIMSIPDTLLHTHSLVA